MDGSGKLANVSIVKLSATEILTALVSAGQGSATRQIAASMDVLPVIRLLDPDLATVTDALQWQIVPHTPLLATDHLDLGVPVHYIHYLSPDPALTSQKFCVAEHVEATLRTRQRNTGSIIRRQKTDVVVAIAAHKTEDDNVILLALVAIHSHNFDPPHGGRIAVLMESP
jgi:hypothetical protein